MIEEDVYASFSKFFEDWCEKTSHARDLDPQQDYFTFTFEIDGELLIHVQDCALIFQI